MDVFEALQELKKETSSAVDTIRQPLAPADRNNGTTPRHARLSREVSSRYKSPTRSNSSLSNSSISNSRRSQSPQIARTSNPSPQLGPKRALSAERKRPTSTTTTPSRERPSTPTSTSTTPFRERPSTPVSDTSAEGQQPLSAKKVGSRLPEVLWPSTMRSLSVSFQSDSISIPVSKKEKERPVLKPSSNVAKQQGETPRKSATPERKRSPLKGRNAAIHNNHNHNHHQSENSRPLDGGKVRGLIDQHRWPSRAGGGKLSSNILAKSVDLSDSGGRRLSGEGVGDNVGMSLRRLSGEGVVDNVGASLRRLSCEGVVDNVGLSLRRLSGEGVVDSNAGMSLRRLSTGGVQDKIPSSPLSNAGISVRKLSAEGVQDSGGKIPSSPLSNAGVSLRRSSAEGDQESGAKIPSSPLSSSGVSLRRLSTDGVQDSGAKIPSSPLSSTGGVSLRRLSTDGVQDSGGKVPSSPFSSSGVSFRRMSVEGGTPRTVQKSSGDPAGQSVSVFEEDSRPVGLRLKSVDDFFLRDSALQKDDPLSSSRRASLGALPIKTKLTPAQRLPSPSRIPIIKANLSPIKTRAPSTPTQRGGASPSRMRPSTPTKQSPSATSVLSFITDMKKGKKTYQLEDAHQLRLLHNRYLQWRFANAQADAAIYIQKVTAEESLYNVWQTNLELWDSVIMKRIDVQRLKLELKLNSVLSEQLAYLDDWALLERDHSSSLDGAIKDLEASTLRLPVIGGAKVNVDSLKGAVSSATDVMQSMSSSIRSVLSKVEDSNRLVSELAALAGQERAMLNECDALLASTAAMQLKEYSLRTQLIQSEQDTMKIRSPILWET